MWSHGSVENPVPAQESTNIFWREKLVLCLTVKFFSGRSGNLKFLRDLTLKQTSVSICYRYDELF